MKNIAFTICSNNYLAQAKVLSDSVFKNSKESYDFYIILCDDISDVVNYDNFHATFVKAEDLNIENFNWMIRNYNIIELNTAIKPFAFRYLISSYNPDYIHYLDPDTCTYTSLTTIEEELEPDKCILLSPHSLSPIPQNLEFPTDTTFLTFGVYNLAS